MAKVTVRGGNVLEKPLLESDDVKTVLVRNSDGRPMLLLVNIRGDTWGVSSSSDPDWKIVLERFGIEEAQRGGK